MWDLFVVCTEDSSFRENLLGKWGLDQPSTTLNGTITLTFVTTHSRVNSGYNPK